MKIISNDEMKNLFLKHREFKGRVKKGFLDDKIHPGITENSLFQLGYLKSELKKACDDKILCMTYIKPNGKTHIKVYLYPGQVFRFHKLKVLINKLCRREIFK